MKYEDISKLLGELAFTEITEHSANVYGDTYSKVTAKRDGLEYHKLFPRTLTIIDIRKPRIQTRLFDCTVTFTCDKTVALKENTFIGLDITIKRTLDFNNAVRLENWFHGK